ncbi:MAG: hypothetical protein RML95_11015 [Anaerolineae bacterium]|nr:hypothetical protein [Anaerolineae bacterium]MDW8299853.1 hypothetical protein [Anaerolineae bacterium]
MPDKSVKVVRVPWLLIGALLLFAILPKVIATLGDPLVPPELAQTATAFAPTAMAHQTREAEEEYTRPSVIVTLLPDECLAGEGSNKRIVESTEILQATPTVTIPPPRIATATPLPPSQKTLVIAAQDAEQSIARDVKEISNPRVTFIAPDQLLITGQVRTPILFFGSITGEIDILGRLEQRNQQFHVTITQLRLNGVDITDDERRRTAEALVNAWIRRRYLLNRDLLSFHIENNTIVAQVLEYSGYRLATLPPSPTPSTNSSTSTPTLAPSSPQLQTATLTPVTAVNRTGQILTDEVATHLARETLTFVRNPRVHFTLEGIEVTGDIALSLVPIAPEVITPFRFVGILGIEGEQLTVAPKVLEIRVVEVARTGIGRQLVEVIQAWLRSALGSVPVTNFELRQGTLIVNQK